MAASVLAAPAARAEVDLKWNAPPGCPARGEVLDRIGALVGTSLDQTEGLSVEGTIERVGGRYSLTLLVKEGQEVRTRVIASDTCADLAGAAAVTLALLLGIEVRSTDAAPGGSTPSNEDFSARPGDNERGSAGSGNEQNEPQERAEAPAKTAPVGPSDPTRRWAGVLRAPIAALDVGPLPKPSVGVGLGIGLRHESWEFVLSGRIAREQTAAAPNLGRDVRAELDRLTGELVACHGWRVDPFEIGPCVAAVIERVTAQGFGTGIVSQSQGTVWPALGAGFVAHWHTFESLAVFAGATGYVELSRPRVVIEGAGEVARLAPAAVGATIGAEWIF